MMAGQSFANVGQCGQGFWGTMDRDISGILCLSIHQLHPYRWYYQHQEHCPRYLQGRCLCFQAFTSPHSITQRSLCKTRSNSPQTDCYNIKKVLCFKTTSDYATTDYPSNVGTTQLQAALTAINSDTTAELCSGALLELVAGDMSRYMAAA